MQLGAVLMATEFKKSVKNIMVPRKTQFGPQGTLFLLSWASTVGFLSGFLEPHPDVFLRVVQFSKGTNHMSKLKIKEGKRETGNSSVVLLPSSFDFPPQPSCYCLFFMSSIVLFFHLLLEFANVIDGGNRIVD